MTELTEKTLDLLNANSEWQERYDGYLKDILKNSDKKNKRFHKPQGLSVYTTVGDRNSKMYYLRFKGQNVSKVRVSKNKITLQCIVNESTSHEIKDCPLAFNETVDWISNKASEFRKFFKGLNLKTKTKSPEHGVENALLEEFRKKRGSDKALKNIQPVLLHGNFFQMPTPLKASTHVPTYVGPQGGGIDMLARIKTTAGHSRLCIIEIKDENKPSESQKAAMSQAIMYATFIARLLTKQPEWMEFFMHESILNRQSVCLDETDIEVITIMPEGETDVFQNESIGVTGTKFTLHCHSLYYDKKEFEDTRHFKFSGTFLNEIRR